MRIVIYSARGACVFKPAEHPRHVRTDRRQPGTTAQVSTSRPRTRAPYLMTVPNSRPPSRRVSCAAVYIYYNGLATKFQNAHSWTALY